MNVSEEINRLIETKLSELADANGDKQKMAEIIRRFGYAMEDLARELDNDDNKDEE